MRPDVGLGFTCRCGHALDNHRHVRPGSDCGICGVERCARFRPKRRLMRRLLLVLRGRRQGDTDDR
jgi:hypothetical protein